MNQQAKGLDAIFEIDTVQDGEILSDIDECSDLAIVEENPENDLKYIRSELKNIISLTKKALETATNAQKEEAIARNSEAVSALLQTSIKALESLNKLNASVNGAKKDSTPGTQNVETQNILVATSADIIEQITNKLKKES